MNFNNNNNNNLEDIMDAPAHQQQQQQQGLVGDAAAALRGAAGQHPHQQQQQEQYGGGVMMRRSTPSPSRHHHQQYLVWTRIHGNNSNGNNNNSDNAAAVAHHQLTTQQQHPLLQPPPRSGAASVVYQDKLYVYGGFGGGTGRLDDFYAYDFIEKSWEVVEVLSERRPGCRENNGVVISSSAASAASSSGAGYYGHHHNNHAGGGGGGGKIILFGGYDGRVWLNDLWEYDITTKCWMCFQESTDNNTVDGAADGGMNQIDESNIAGGQGQQQPVAAAAAAPGVVGAAAVGSAADVPVLQQQQQYFASPHAALSSVAAQQQQQQQLQSTTTETVTATGGILVRQGRIPSRRFGYVSVVHNNKFILYGGFDGTNWLNDMFVFDFGTRTWMEIVTSSAGSAGAGGAGHQDGRTTVPTARSCPAWAKDDTHAFIHGGYDGVERKSDFWALNLNTYTWHQITHSTGDPPTARYFHSACLFGTKLYIYGGYSGNERLANMYAYDFDTNHWCEIIPANHQQHPNNHNHQLTDQDVPSGRSSFVLQVYQNCCYIFGGYDGTAPRNDFFEFRFRPMIHIPSTSLTTDLTRLINQDDELADVCFLVRESSDPNDTTAPDAVDSGGATSTASAPSSRQRQHRVYAHRAILAIRSDYFRVMLTGHMREGRRVRRRRRRANSKSIIGSTTANAAAGRANNDSDNMDVTTADENDDDDDDSSTGAAAGRRLNIEDDQKRSARDNTDDSMMDQEEEEDGDQMAATIEIPNVSYPVFLKVLEYIYTDEVTPPQSTTTTAMPLNNNEATLELYIQLLIASELFLLGRLKSICEELIRQFITTDNVVQILVVSHRHSATQLKNVALEFILYHLSQPHYGSDPTIMIGLDELRVEPDLLLEIIRRSAMNNNNVATIGHAAVVAHRRPQQQQQQQQFNNNIINNNGAANAANARFGRLFFDEGHLIQQQQQQQPFGGVPMIRINNNLQQQQQQQDLVGLGDAAHNNNNNNNVVQQQPQFGGGDAAGT